MHADQGPLLAAHNLVQEYGLSDGRSVQAVANVSFELRRGENLAIVGETASGKTTLVRSIVQAPRPKSGSVLLLGEDLTKLRGKELVRSRRQIQMVFQDPFASLNPKWLVSDIVEEPLLSCDGYDRRRRRERVAEVLELVGMQQAVYGRRRPAELSGGECQRVAIARALAPWPKVIICDEAVSSLDAIIQAQIVGLLKRLSEQFAISYLFISHDLALVSHISDRVAVMYLGQLCEIGDRDAVFAQPAHPYTAMLVAVMRASLRSAAAQEPLPAPSRHASAAHPPVDGCRFRARCARARDVCTREAPTLRSVSDGHLVACHFPQR